ncbi:MAG: DUF6470 family protein [Firmicutes bacterium]|nr:DUF6470 family protein [Bacillota bacterium]
MIVVPNIPSIQIEQQCARIGIHTTNAKLMVNTPPPTRMRIYKEAPRMEIERKAPVFKMETPRKRPERPLPYTSNPGMPLTWQRDKVVRRNSDIIVQASESAKQGNSVTLNDNAVEMNKILHDYTSASIAESLQQSMPSIEWEAGYININWSKAQMQIEWEKNDYMPSFSVEPHSVEIYLREKPYIRITLSDEVIASIGGPQMDTKI